MPPRGSLQIKFGGACVHVAPKSINAQRGAMPFDKLRVTAPFDRLRVTAPLRDVADFGARERVGDEAIHQRFVRNAERGARIGH